MPDCRLHALALTLALDRLRSDTGSNAALFKCTRGLLRLPHEQSRLNAQMGLPGTKLLLLVT